MSADHTFGECVKLQHAVTHAPNALRTGHPASIAAERSYALLVQATVGQWLIDYAHKRLEKAAAGEWEVDS
jgi:hypothetical protein